MERAKLRKTIYLCGILFLFLNFLVVYNWSSIYYRKTRDNPDGVKGILEDVSRKSSVQDIQLPGQKVRNILDKDTEVLVNITRNCFCKNWAVVTTIFSASDAVRKVAQDPVWCLVIVADMKTPNKNDYITELNANTNQTIVFLTPEEQDYTFPLLSKFIPWNHFARKNIGYMYAIKQGASFIWDFDDDNINVIPLTLTDTVRYKAPCRKDTHAVFNPYPYFSVNETHTWPRGFPLEHIRNPQTVPYLCNSTSAQRRNIAVIQSLANIQPDVDAIYRFTRDTPFSFGATPESHLPVMVPSFSYSPFNAQATLWARDAFRYLALPTSISPRVSDIWRSYIAEYFFHKEAMSVMFVPPYVDQHRNYHDYLQDFKEETDLYQKSSEFIELLRSCVTNNLDILQSEGNNTALNSSVPVPLIVIGILSNANYKCLRDSQRYLFVRAAKAYRLLNIKVVFLLDHATPMLEQEQKTYNDLVYLNTTEHGWDVSFAKKLYNWYSYAVKHFPDAILIGRMDDDVFVCTPQIFDRLNTVKKRLLYYGYETGRCCLDDMFLFVGIDLAKRIVSRPMCDSQITNKCLKDGNAVRRLREWVSIYRDLARVDEKKSGKMIHYNARGVKGQIQMLDKYAHYKENFCEKHLLFHKATPEYMVELEKSNTFQGNNTAKQQLSDEEIKTMYNCTVHNF